MRVPLVFGWSMTVVPVPVPGELAGVHSCLLPGSVVLALLGARGRAEAVWERRRCGGRGGWLLLELEATSFLADGRTVFLPRGRAIRSLEGVLGMMAAEVGLRPGGSVVRSALRAFPPGDVGALAVALSVMES